MFALSLIGIVHAGSYEDIELPAHTFEGGWAGGYIAASTQDSSCVGWIHDHPDHDLTKGWIGEKVVTAYADSPMALVAVRQSDGEVECTGFSKNPTLQLDDDAGNEVWHLHTATQTAGASLQYDLQAFELAGHGTTGWFEPATTVFTIDTVKATETGCFTALDGSYVDVSSTADHLIAIHEGITRPPGPPCQ